MSRGARLAAEGVFGLNKANPAGRGLGAGRG